MNRATATYEPGGSGEPVWVGAPEDEPPEGADLGDDDYDLLPNWLEDHHGTDRYNPDSDGDGATDGDEVFLMGTDPLLWDTDGNGRGDFEDLFFSVHGYYPGEEPPSDPDPEDPEDPDPEPQTLAITTSEVPSISESAPYSFAFSAEGGAGGYAWSLSGGMLPGDLTLAADGTLSGDGGSANEGGHTFEVTVQDQNSDSVSQSFTLTVGFPDPVDPEADPDGDGLPNGVESQLGSDPNQQDSMTPGVSDWFYWYFSHLGPHASDTDGDGDGLGALLEAALGTSDGSWDSAGGFYGDRYEYYFQVLAPADDSTDADGDGLSDLLEQVMGMNPQEPDSDGDGLPDAHEWEHIAYSSPWLWDSDGDGLDDGLEAQLGTQARLADSDGDHLSDAEEHHQVYGAFDPVKWSTANDGVPDYFRADLTDSDSGGIPDRLEIFWGLNPLNAADEAGDIDADSVTNLDEYMTGYDIWGGWRDTLDWDGDGMTNVYEMFFGLDPEDPADGADDPDGDFVTNHEESLAFTHPWTAHTLVDFDEQGAPPSVPELDGNGDPVVDAENNQVYRHPANDFEFIFGLDFAAGTAHLTRGNGTVEGREYDDDWDGDGISNHDELYLLFTNPRQSEAEPPGQLALSPLSGTLLASLPSGGSLHQSFTATGGSGGYAWTLNGGPLWLHLDPDSGLLSGQAPAAQHQETHTLSVTVTDTATPSLSATGWYLIHTNSAPPPDRKSVV